MYNGLFYVDNHYTIFIVSLSIINIAYSSANTKTTTKK